MLEIMKSYLTDRKKILRYGAARTNLRIVTFGVPKFSFRTTTFHHIRQWHQTTMQLLHNNALCQRYCSAATKNTNEVLFQRDIENIGLYLSDNNLTLNVEKTINLNLGFKTMMKVLRMNIATHKKSNEVKYLGVLLDNKLDFKKQINSVTAKLTKFTGLFYKIRFILSIKQLVLVYKSFVQPVIQSGVLTYGTANKTSLKFIEVKIKQILRIIFRKQSHQSTANEREKYGIFLVKELHIYEVLNFLTKTIRREHENEVFNRFIEDSKLVRLDEKRTTSKKLKPSNQFTGINPEKIGIRIRKLLNYILNFDSKYVQLIKSCYESGINTHHHTFLESIIQGNDIIELFFEFF